MTNLIIFEEALKIAGDKRHLLLGNGFSIAWNKDIFQYKALIDQADFTDLNVDAKKLFGSLGTVDFEIVINALRRASMLADLYSESDSALSEKFTHDADQLKSILAKTIAKNHPDQPNAIEKSEYEFCRRFLINFSDIYTLNYDLLLYWVLMHSESGDDIKCDDGFRNSDDSTAEYVIWDNGNAHSQNIHYLHGALHLFDAGTELKKYTWTKTGIKLLDQIRESLDSSLFPLIVTEGSSDEKLTRINHSGYLHKAKRSFLSIGGSLFIHGHSLADNDDHILMEIPESKINKLFVGFMSDPRSKENTKKVLKIQNMIEQRKKMVDDIKKSKRRTTRQELEVYFYDSNSANVWREQGGDQNE